MFKSEKNNISRTNQLSVFNVVSENKKIKEGHGRCCICKLSCSLKRALAMLFTVVHLSPEIVFTIRAECKQLKW